MFGRSTRSLEAFRAPPSWTARPIECPSPWMNRPLYFVRSIRFLAAASTDFPVEPGFIFARAAAWARATVSCIRLCSSDAAPTTTVLRSEEHTSELQSQSNLVCRLLLEKKKTRDTAPGG